MTHQVTTVRGPVPAEELGVTLMHEHVLIDMTREIRHGGILNDVGVAKRELELFRDRGGRTVVDLTVRGLGGDPGALRRISEATGLHIVLGAGFYRHQFLDMALIDQTPTPRLADLITRDLVEGIGATGVRAGIIGEIACDEWITAAEERVFRAAARAHLRTGAAITTHAARWPVGHVQLDLLEEEGVEARYVIIGHSDSVASVDWDGEADVTAYHRTLAARGAYVELDNIRALAPHELERRVRYVRSLIDHGYLHHVLLSHDVAVQAHLRCNGGGGYSFILDEFSALLRAAGTTEQELHTILVDNPRRALSGAARPPVKGERTTS
ncbi:phosphotriesterase family protein [Nocardioides daeguensis]|uniref:Phosphotriesterase n=1 Tax=Nocardioides daeguensis TaxID=908359 RepID=A0ABP6WBC2_9ACTN|nr:hypothetical protein [Nocardioides daeguensis]MBV6729813.1 hypothetical protein [Nocardioides daeguensis]MCR1775384.1 hypothetical protein [Nocardioides daeguensis]